MTNFEWEQIEKEAEKKKTTVVITVVLLLVFFFVFYKYEMLSSKREPIIKEKIMEEKNIKKTQNVIEKKENIYTVKIGPFNDPMLVADFLDKTGMDKIKGIYKSGGSYYLNIGRINNMDKALLKKDEFIEKGFPAIIEKFDPNIDYDPTILSEIDEIKAKKELNEKESTQEEFVPEFTAEDQIDAQKKEGWTIQVAAADSIKSATELKNKLRFTGIEYVIVNEPPYYKVQIGMFSTREEALEYSKKLDMNIIPGVYVKKVKR
ncbi:MAG: hypothetical protein C0601_05365 [Candidatus Muiribacterium halophilum]|uniref:SPOR domain-containing protein n=1 Tax=Muiribacterium halophilum TaxID=2053465 RepID=A0A2N5ZHL2_MUIH1|nr:MAG: hypothetical protein C0601_05365 [Candidatus Muirbacterium halophilum]